tara:strand:+ start:555 stop:764 length:210 start_codon:yes stop_codon:yes gene_type:complete
MEIKKFCKPDRGQYICILLKQSIDQPRHYEVVGMRATEPDVVFFKGAQRAEADRMYDVISDRFLFKSPV